MHVGDSVVDKTDGLVRAKIHEGKPKGKRNLRREYTRGQRSRRKVERRKYVRHQ